jgi:hypothetical protein
MSDHVTREEERARELRYFTDEVELYTRHLTRSNQRVDECQRALADARLDQEDTVRHLAHAQAELLKVLMHRGIKVYDVEVIVPSDGSMKQLLMGDWFSIKVCAFYCQEGKDLVDVEIVKVIELRPPFEEGETAIGRELGVLLVQCPDMIPEVLVRAGLVDGEEFVYDHKIYKVADLQRP